VAFAAMAWRTRALDRRIAREAAESRGAAKAGEKEAGR